MSPRTRTMAAQQILAAEGGVKPFGFDRKVLSQGRAGFEIANTLDVLHEQAFRFALNDLAGLLELGLIEAGRMVRRAQAAKTRETTGEIDKANSVRESFRAVTGADAAAEIADTLVALRGRAVEFDMKFLGYLLEMAYIETFELSQKHDR